MTERPPTSFRLSPECRELLRRIGERLGIRDSAVIEIAVRRLAAQELESVQTPKPTAKKPSKRKGE
jgi:hypothetical protein